MRLTVDEEEMLAGKRGRVYQKAMQILFQLGEIYGAEKMIPVSNVHMPGASVIVAGKAGTRLVEEMAKEGGIFAVSTTLNPAAGDFNTWQEIGFAREDMELQERLTGGYREMGAVPCHTCTPYLTGNIPRKGEHVAWGESSAIAFANSVLGARTNREGGPSALAAALVGRVPAYGYHLDENRRGQVLINVNTELNGPWDYGTLGYWAGNIVQERVPVFKGIPWSVSLEELKLLGAALASSGSVALFHVLGVTPEAPDLETVFGGSEPVQFLEYTEEAAVETVTRLNKHKGDRVDLVAVGCPHASIQEIGQVAEMLRGKRLADNTDMWILAALPVKTMADRMGYTKEIEAAGAQIVCDTCPVLGSTAAVVKKRGYRSLATNSAKLAHYSPGSWNLDTFYGSINRCVKAALSGRWS
ncbi:MAG: hypothetical protein CVU89_08550 [Firmicutes bacterium HGW-Firmicutes-14]|nr:MAG: hypothetical protein CVU89_08550 [Firmicutes bacterium HGW-Firmicutes-14]